MSLAAAALKRARFTLVGAVGVLLAGFAALFGFPSTEEPIVPFRFATIEALMPGASSERTEQLVARPIEERVRQIAEVKTVETVVRPGYAYIAVSLHPDTPTERLPAVWQRLRAKADDARAVLPAGATGPIVNDEFGRVSVFSLALTGEGYSAGQLQDWARKLRTRLQVVPGIEQVSLHGVQEERIYVELSPARLAEQGLLLTDVALALTERNIVAPSGEITADNRVFALETNGDLPDAAALAAVQVPLPDGGSLPLATLGAVRQGPADPPSVAALYNGARSVVLAVSMRQGENVGDLATRLRTAKAQLQRDLPAGMRLAVVTDQAVVVNQELLKVAQIFAETVVIVLAVVVLFLGWRAGLVTGLIVPLTVFATLIVMRMLQIELHMVSIAAIIISLGIFVDNAIVIVEDYQRRLHDGEDKASAAEAAGRTMAAPLLISSLAVIFAFAPLVMGASESAEYMRSLAIVLAATLLVSLFLALTVTVVTAQLFAGHADHEKEERGVIAKVRRWYADHVRWVLRRPIAVVGSMAGLLAASLAISALLPQELFSPSNRSQAQILVELPPGASSRETYALAEVITERLAVDEAHPALIDAVAYVGDGGPRFILGLNPPTPAAHRAYVVVNLDQKADLDDAISRMREDLGDRFPQARIEPKRFSLGVSEAGTAVFRLQGPDREALLAAAEALKSALRAMPGKTDIADDAEGRISRLVVEVDQTRALAAGVTNATIAQALEAAYSGGVATVLRQGDILVPVVLRAPEEERISPEYLLAMPVLGANGPVPLAEVARVRLADQPSVLIRRNEQPTITVSVRHETLTAQGIVDAAQPALAALNLPSGHTVALGGEIEEAADANSGLVTYFPLALLGMAALFLWQFGSVRKTAIVMASIPFVMIGSTLGLAITGQPFSYTATLGLLALAGIIVNNAVLLLERITEEKALGKSNEDAVADAAAVRLRPILMTKLTCVTGLAPLFIFGGDLWRPLAAAMIGGLSLGTLITLVLIPALYTLMFATSARPKSAPVQALETLP